MSTAGHLTTFGPAQRVGGRAIGRWRSKTKGDSYVSAHSKLLIFLIFFYLRDDLILFESDTGMGRVLKTS